MSPKPYLNCSLASFDQVSSDMIRKIFEKLPPKSCPSDPVPARLLKTCTVELLPAITTLINSSLQNGVFPTAFKEGRILPKIKKISLDKEDFSNYRPVMNLPFLSKVLERVASIQLQYVTISRQINSILDFNQHTENSIVENQLFCRSIMIFSELSIRKRK